MTDNLPSTCGKVFHSPTRIRTNPATAKICTTHNTATTATDTPDTVIRAVFVEILAVRACMIKHAVKYYAYSALFCIGAKAF